MKWSAKEIIILRKQMGWTRNDLARRLECCPKMLHGVEKGEVSLQGQILFQLHRIQEQANHKRTEIQPLEDEVKKLY